MSPLARRDFRLLLAGQGVSILGDRLLAVALAFAVLEVGGSAADVGLVLAARVAPMAVVVLLGGVVADRVARRRLMVVADLVRVATQGLIAALLIAGAAEVWMLAGLTAVGGVATGFFGPAATGLLPEVVPPGHLQRANALRATVSSAGEIAGPVLAGLLVAVAGAGWAIAVDAATFLVSAACLLALRTAAPRGAATATSFVADLREGWTAVRTRRWLWAFVLYISVANLMWAAWSAVGPLVADRDLGGAGPWGVVLGVLGVGALAGGLAATRLPVRRPLLVFACCEGLLTLPIAALAAGAPLGVLAFAAALCGAGMMIGTATWESTLQREIPAATLSRVSSYDWFASYAFYPVGLALWGPLGEVLGLTTVLWLAFGLFLVAIAALVALPEVRRFSPGVAPPQEVL